MEKKENKLNIGNVGNAGNAGNAGKEIKSYTVEDTLIMGDKRKKEIKDKILNSKKPSFYIFPDGEFVANDEFKKLAEEKQEEKKKEFLKKQADDLKKMELYKITEKIDNGDIKKESELIEGLNSIINVSSKEYDIKKAKKINERNATEPEKFLKRYLLGKVNNFNSKDNGKYILQCSNILKNTSFIFIKNSSDKFTDKNCFNVCNVANVLKTLAYEKQTFLAMVATKNGDGFNILKVCDTLEEYKKRYNIETPAKKEKTTNTSNGDNNGDNNGDTKKINKSKVFSKEMTADDIKKYMTEILTSSLKGTEKLATIENFFGIKK